MFRLLKLAMMALFGYAIYQFFQGMTQGGGGSAAMGMGQDVASSPAEQADQSRGGIITDATATGGLEARTEDAFGTSTTHRVGRGAGI
jgi:hypothetical protein